MTSPFKGLIVPANPKEAIREMEAPLADLCRNAGFRWASIVRTKLGSENNFVMVVNEDGHDMRDPYNPRAQYLSGYPLQSPIVGGAIFLTEVMYPDGADFISLSEPGQRYIQDGAKWEKRGFFDQWCFANFEQINHWRWTFPLSVQRGPDPDAKCLGHDDGSPNCDGSCRLG